MKLIGIVAVIVPMFLASTLEAAGHYCDDAADSEQEMCWEAFRRGDGACEKILDDTERLRCWDTDFELKKCSNKFSRPAGETQEQCQSRVLGLHEVTTPEPGQAKGMWLENVEISNFTDDTNVYVSLPSWNVIECNGGRSARLYLRCSENKTSAFLAHGCYTPTRRGDWPIQYRIDKDPLVSTELPGSSDNDALGWWTYREARPFIESLFGKDRLYIRFRDYSGSSAELEFRVHGAEVASKTLRETCGWP